MNFFLKVKNSIAPFAYSIYVYERKTGKILFFLKGNNKEWYADPFLIKYDGEYHLLFEDMVTKRGKAFLSDICLNTRFKKTIIQEPFHLSFPNVFWGPNECLYMIPESIGSNQLRVYKKKDDWKLEKVLLTNRKLADNIVFNAGNSAFLIGYDMATSNEYSLCFFSFDPSNLTVGNELFRISDPKKEYRPAGQILDINGHHYLPTQKCDKIYGESIFFREIVCGENGFILSKPIDNLLRINPIIHKYARHHTYNECDDLVCIDVSKRCFHPGFLTRFLIKKIKRK